MTTFASEEVKCRICGKKTEFPVVMSTNAFGATDLDLRPPEMERSTMPYWVHECPLCGYVSYSVEDDTLVDREWLSSEAYQTCDGVKFSSKLAQQFYKFYLINLKDDSPDHAFRAICRAAWASDDDRDEENAQKCRQLGINILNDMIEKSRFENEADKETAIVTKADLMRRVGDFEGVIREYSGYHNDNSLLEDIIAFQLKKAKEQDTGCYTVSDVTGE